MTFLMSFWCVNVTFLMRFSVNVSHKLINIVFTYVKYWSYYKINIIYILSAFLQNFIFFFFIMYLYFSFFSESCSWDFYFYGSHVYIWFPSFLQGVKRRILGGKLWVKEYFSVLCLRMHFNLIYLNLYTYIFHISLFEVIQYQC